MNYRQGISSAIASAITGLDVGWRSQESRMRDPNNVTLTLRGIRYIGVPERRLTDTGPDLQERVMGPQSLRVLITCEGPTDGTSLDTVDIDGSLSGSELAETVRSHLHTSTATEILCLANLGRAILGPVFDVSYTDDHGSHRSVWAFEATFPTARTQNGALIPWIECVEWGGDIIE